MKREKHQLREDDRILFEQMENSYVSEAEKNFFETMKYKEEYEDALETDEIMCRENNEDGIVIFRTTYDEYVLGRRGFSYKFEFESLSELLKADLSAWSLPKQTVLEWLRIRCYKGVTYDQNQSLE